MSISILQLRSEPLEVVRTESLLTAE